MRVAERCVRVRCNDPLITGYLRTAWRMLALPERTASAEECDEAAVTWDGEHASVELAGQALPLTHVAGDRQDAALSAQAALLAATFRRLTQHRALYAAGFATPGGALALVGPSGAGKTTLMLELARRGHKIFGDEFVLLERTGFVAHAFPLDFMLRAPTLALVADARLDAGARTLDGLPALDSLPGRRLRVDIAQAFGADVWACPSPLTDVVLLHRADAGGTRIENVPAAAAALEMLPHFFIDSLAMSDVWEALENVAPLRCRRLFMADHTSAADALEALA